MCLPKYTCDIFGLIWTLNLADGLKVFGYTFICVMQEITPGTSSILALFSKFHFNKTQCGGGGDECCYSVCYYSQVHASLV
jgi:hypothetical protein